MTDRELLEYAAKACGFEVVQPIGDSGFFGLWVRCVGRSRKFRWNSLQDDGDALRLAAECKLTVCMDGDASVSAHTAYDPSICFVTQFINHRECKHAAIRRAITRAAAQIQLNKEQNT